MKLIYFGLSLLLSGVIMFQQNDYKLIFERMELISHNKTYVDMASAHNYKYNRTQAVVNITAHLTRNMGHELQIEVQAYRFASNEYRLFPLRFMFSFCDYVARNELGLGELFHCANLTGCPLNKGTYNFCNWKPNGEKCPPHIPQGSYRMDLRLFYRDIEIMFFEAYAIFKYPEVKGFSFY